jgi:diacylglycerol O-acyltransferase
VDRLTGPDLSGFVPESRGWAADIGAIAVLQGAPLVDANGQLRIAKVQRRIAGRLPLAPRLRQVVTRPPWGLGRPLWVDAGSFDIDTSQSLARAPQASCIRRRRQRACGPCGCC